jgi:hypothetical protein
MTITGTRYRAPSRAVAPVLLLSVAANAALAAPPGIRSNSLEVVARAAADALPRNQREGLAAEQVRAAYYTVSDGADPHERRTGPTERVETDAADGDAGRPITLDELVVEFLDSL